MVAQSRLLAVLLALLMGGTLIAQESDSKLRWEEHNELVRSRQSIDPLGTDLFGDNANYYSGGLSFSNTDTAIPGNNSLPVAITRVYSVTDHRGKLVRDLAFADWDIDLPNVGGVFAAQTGWPAAGRCTQTTYTPAPTIYAGGEYFFAEDYWNGLQMNIPGRGSQDLLLAHDLLANNPGVPRPANGSWYWSTSDLTYVACLTSIQNGVGQGFEARTSDGVTYRFDWMAENAQPKAEKMACDAAGACVPAVLQRKRYRLYATRVEDRFGNWVEYTYTNAANAPVRLTAVSSNDGRSITLAYNAQGHVSMVTENGRSWTYAYNTVNNRRTLSGVTLPDASLWTIDFGALSSLNMDVLPIPPGEPWTCTLPREVAQGQATGTITHPSGAVGAFVVKPRLFGRSNVPMVCTNVGGPNPQPDQGDSVLPVHFYAPALVEKRISGPGLALAEWNYSYGGTFGFTGTIGSSWAVIEGPDNSWTRLTYGNAYQQDEGLLITVERGTGPSSILESSTTTYQINTSNQPYHAVVGAPSSPLGGDFPSAARRPVSTRTTTRQGVSFNWRVCFAGYCHFDHLARPTTVRRDSSLGFTRTDTTQYVDNITHWVLGQVSQVTNDDTGRVLVQRTFSPFSLPLTEQRFGLQRETLTWNADGTLATVRDPVNPPTTLSNWKRGIPQLITYPDNTTASAVVNNRGEITQITDPLGFVHAYSYDAMGRLAQIQYPTGDPVSWAPTTFSFVKSGSSAYGLPAGHWQHTVATGNYRRVTFLDGRWRPVLTREYDIADAAGTNRFVASRFDHENRSTFSSFPLPNVSTWSSPIEGIHKTYDALGRLVQSRQHAGGQDYITAIAYLSNFQRQVTDARGNQTTLSFQAFDSASEDSPIQVLAPEGQTTVITRDVFGKPLTIARSGFWNGSGVSATRTFVYDANERLCKRIDPESGATIFDYDAAGNIAWTTSGSNLTGGSCNRASVPSSERTHFHYDDRNRVTTVNYPGTTADVAFAYYADGALSAITSGNSAWLYQYNRRRLLTQETLNHDGLFYTFGMAYDAHGHLTTRSHPGNLIANYAPNALGQPSQVVTSLGTFATAAQFNPDGSVKQFTYGNGIVRSVTQDARRLPGQVLDAYGTNAIVDFGYSYDGVGNVTEIVDNSNDGFGGRQDRTMSYDGLNRLTQANAPGLWGTATYAYDGLDNLREASVGARSYAYAYDANTWRLTGITGTGGAPSWSFSYDARGNQTTRTGTGTNQARLFDAANRMTEITSLASYHYDGHGRRTQTTRQDGSTLVSVYTLDGVLRYQRNEGANQVKSHLYLGGTFVGWLEDHALPPATSPTLSAPTASLSGAFTVSWTTVATANRYQLQQRVNGGTWSTIHDAAGTSKAVSGQAPGVWDFRVRACNNGGCGSWSSTKTTQVYAPPTLSSPAANLSGAYTVSWTAVTSATSYQLEQRLNSGAWSTIHNASGTSKALSGQAAGSWDYRVRACNGGDCTPYSAIKNTQVYGPPTLSAPATNTTGSYTVSWTAVTSATSYQLQQRLNGGAWSTIHNAAGTSKALSGQAAGSWDYQVRACNGSDCTGYSAIKTTVVTLPPATAPTLTGPELLGAPASYTISWNTVATATSYELQENLNGGAFTTLQNTAATSRGVVDKPAGWWGYRVRACNSAGCGPWSATHIVTVEDLGGCDPLFGCTEPQSVPEDPPEDW